VDRVYVKQQYLESQSGRKLQRGRESSSPRRPTRWPPRRRRAGRTEFRFRERLQQQQQRAQHSDLGPAGGTDAGHGASDDCLIDQRIDCRRYRGYRGRRDFDRHNYCDGYERQHGLERHGFERDGRTRFAVFSA